MPVTVRVCVVCVLVLRLLVNGAEAERVGSFFDLYPAKWCEGEVSFGLEE